MKTEKELVLLTGLGDGTHLKEMLKSELYSQWKEGYFTVREYKERPKGKWVGTGLYQGLDYTME